MDKIGIDFGTFSIKVVKIEDDKIKFKKEYKENEIKQLINDLPDCFILGICNYEVDNYSFLKQDVIKKGVNYLYPNVKSFLSIGAEKSEYIVLENDEVTMYQNSHCSSGTGSFLEEQALRLKVSLEDIGRLALQSKKDVMIAGRCSVFSKTDMIHHMQEGTPLEDILNGLCHAMVRNYKSNVLKKHEVYLPLGLIGGATRNQGVQKAIQDLITPQIAYNEDGYLALAIGAALLGEKEITKEEFKKLMEGRHKASENEARTPLNEFVKKEDSAYFEASFNDALEGYLGIDVGSTSVNLVLVDKNRNILYKSYTKNKGNSLECVKSELDILRKRLPKYFKIVSSTTTGSGREYIQYQVGATSSVNEITAQALGAVNEDDSIDTIFEIGGQDSKYISLDHGKVIDFEMNKVCAAGTGSFLEEQIYKLNLKMDEFISYALKSKNPCLLGDRCTVFIESSIARELSRGTKIEDICAGLAYAIVNNYLNRVVNNKHIGKNITIQGGIAYNEAVVCAFRSILNNKDIKITTNFDVTGAYGAALSGLLNQKLTLSSEKNKEFDKYLLDEANKTYLADHTHVKGKVKGTIGIPRVLFLHKMYPLFKILFESLGYKVIVSPKTNSEIVALSQKYIQEETCFPVKLIYGHVAYLLKQDIDFIFLPRLYTIKHEGAMARKNYSCVYMQTSALMMDKAFDFSQGKIKLLMPEFSLQYGKIQMAKSVLSLSNVLKIEKRKMIFGALKAIRYFNFRDKYLEKLSRSVLKDNEPTLVLVSRVYNMEDPILNMGIEDHLQKLGIRFIRLENLDAEYMNTNTFYWDMCWPFGQHMLTGIGVLKKYKHLYPIYITNHGCGPDTAIQHFVHHELNDRPFLHLEVDEHSSPIGVATRIEAFLYTIMNSKVNEVKKEKLDIHPTTNYLPEFGLYTSLYQKENDVISSGIEKHTAIHYAYNKEAFSILYLFEELYKNIPMDKEFNLVIPRLEGSDPTHVANELMVQELNQRGYHLSTSSFFLEDLIKKDNYLDIFTKMVDLEVNNVLSKDKVALLVGEPFIIYREKLLDYAIPQAKRNGYSLIPMPLSEALVFYYEEIYKGQYQDRINKIKEIINSASGKLGNKTIYSNNLDVKNNDFKFVAGNFTRYRKAKAYSASSSFKVINITSAEENEEIILKNIYLDRIKNVYSIQLDFEHLPTSEELMVIFK